MFDRVTSTRYTLDYPGVAGLMCHEHAFPPIPSERIMPLAEFLMSQGRFSLIGGVGALVGAARVTAWIEQHGPWLAVSRRDIERAKGRLDRHGAYPGRLLGARDTHVETVLGPVSDGVLGLLVAWWVVEVVTRRRAGGPRGEGS